MGIYEIQSLALVCFVIISGFADGLNDVTQICKLQDRDGVDSPRGHGRRQGSEVQRLVQPRQTDGVSSMSEPPSRPCALQRALDLPFSAKLNDLRELLPTGRGITSRSGFTGPGCLS